MDPPCLLFADFWPHLTTPIDTVRIDTIMICHMCSCHPAASPERPGVESKVTQVCIEIGICKVLRPVKRYNHWSTSVWIQSKRSGDPSQQPQLDEPETVLRHVRRIELRQHRECHEAHLPIYSLLNGTSMAGLIVVCLVDARETATPLTKSVTFFAGAS